MATINPRITPCLWFDGQAEEAAEHYCSIFENARVKHVQRYPEELPEGMPGNPGAVMVVVFELDGQEFVGLNGGPQFPHTEAISFQVHCADQAEIDHYWERLTDGGEESVCGWCRDRFGVSWQVTPVRLLEILSTGTPEQARAATEAFMSMRKLDLPAIEAAVAAVPA